MENRVVSKKRLVLGVLGMMALVPIAVVVYVGFQVVSGRAMIDFRSDPSVRELKAYVNGLTDVQQIEVIYRPQSEWIREPLRNPAYKEVVVTITDPDEIEQIMRGFKKARHFYSGWTQCGFYFRLDLYGAGEQVGTILVGFDDCKSFTTSDIRAVGEMGNDYFYREYVVSLR
jgi:hypothetical protein